jgi:hypothetical protein
VLLHVTEAYNFKDRHTIGGVHISSGHVVGGVWMGAGSNEGGTHAATEAC